jgi:hypothetical protein
MSTKYWLPFVYITINLPLHYETPAALVANCRQQEYLLHLALVYPFQDLITHMSLLPHFSYFWCPHLLLLSLLWFGVPFLILPSCYVALLLVVFTCFWLCIDLIFMMPFEIYE